jgi:MFS family permease
MVFGGRVGDLLGLRRVFLAGSVVFLSSTALAGVAQDMAWMIAVRATQGVGAALMMPTAMAIVAAVFPEDRRGTALGILAGASAFFAAVGPVLGGNADEHRLAAGLPDQRAARGGDHCAHPSGHASGGRSGERRPIDYPGVVSFGVGIAAVVFGLSQGEPQGWGSAETVIPLVVGLLCLALFI